MEIALLALVCPIGMGLMMWFMAKGMSMGRDKDTARSEDTDQPSLEELRTQQAHLASRVSELERDKAASSVR